MTNDHAPLLSEEEDHPQEVVAEHAGTRVVVIDSARYCDARNGGDVVIAASYCGVLPVRLMVPHHPRAIIGHDVNIAADGSGISGIFYAEGLGIPAAAVAGSTAELGNGLDMYHEGRISRVNILAERCGVKPGMTTVEAARLLATGSPGNTEPGTKVRREVKHEGADGRSIVVTDSIVFATPADSRNVLVTAGHTGKTGARFIETVSPHGFICADGGGSKNDSGISGLADLQRSGLAGACYDITTAAMGDAFDAWDRGLVSACNDLARDRGVRVGQTVQEAAAHLLGAGEAERLGGTAAARSLRDRSIASAALRTGELRAVSAKFAEGLARVREVTDLDGALPAGVKALFMAAAATVKGHHTLARRELRRAVAAGVSNRQLWGAAVSVLISRGEAVYENFVASMREANIGLPAPRAAAPTTDYAVSVDSACEYFKGYFGFVPDYIQIMADAAPRALEGYVLMREWALAENVLEAKYVELLLCTVNAAEFSARFVDVHAGGARRAGASEAEIAEAVVCAIPVAGVASWLPGADGIAAGASAAAGKSK